MNKLFIYAAFSILAADAAYAQPVYVRPHVRSDGTYVPGHMRTAPNSTRADNWSSVPNINPYTGRQGTKDPYHPQVHLKTSQSKPSCTYYCY